MNLLAQYELAGHKKAVEILMAKKLLLRIPNAGKTFESKRIGTLTAAVIIGEIGDISRYQYPRQIMKIGT